MRYPKGELGDPLPTLERRGKPRSAGGVDVLAEHGKDARVIVFGLGAMASTAVEVAGKIAAEGVSVRAASATWVVPVPPGLADAVSGAELVVTIEDGLVDGGIGAAWEEAAGGARGGPAWAHFGVPREFLEHASRAQIVEAVGLEAATIAERALAALGS